jgi:hypothetical protein
LFDTAWIWSYVASKIMSKIVKKVLSIDLVVRSATDSYADDIIV